MDFKEKDKFIVCVMQDGEDLIENLKILKENFKNYKILTVLSALGMLKDVKTGYWNGKEYEIHEINEPVELLGISGIITPETDPFYHFHIFVGDRKGNVKGGHLIEAKVLNTLEMFLIKGDIEVKREEEKGLKKLKIV